MPARFPAAPVSLTELVSGIPLVVKPRTPKANENRTPNTKKINMADNVSMLSNEKK